jgi:hypothetical protein
VVERATLGRLEEVNAEAPATMERIVATESFILIFFGKSNFLWDVFGNVQVILTVSRGRNWSLEPPES